MTDPRRIRYKYHYFWYRGPGGGSPAEMNASWPAACIPRGPLHPVPAAGRM
ncbi:MAG: hypothetical protein MPL62_15425 [Alphaproteobacteria bacterium]|nr:hypothetical protein [Alphaproteobacteria bacterium]